MCDLDITPNVHLESQQVCAHNQTTQDTESCKGTHLMIHADVEHCDVWVLNHELESMHPDRVQAVVDNRLASHAGLVYRVLREEKAVTQE